MITAIDPNAIRVQSKEKKTSTLPGVGFSDFLAASNPVASTAISLEKGYQPAAVTSAAITGITGVPGALGSPANAPYVGGQLYTASTPFAAGGYDYSGSAYAAGAYPQGGGVVPTGAYGPYGTAGAYGGWSSQDNFEKSILLSRMNDENMDMLFTQEAVNKISRDYNAVSNMLKTKFDTERNSIQNMRS